MIDRGAFEEDPAWLMLPVSRRSAALDRLEGLRWYLEESDRSVVAIGQAATTAKISPRLFYELLKVWEGADHPTIWSLVPYAGRKATGRPKLDETVEQKLSELITSSLGRGQRPRDDVVADVVTNWPSGQIRQPALNTIRRHVERLAQGALYRSASDRDDPASGDFLGMKTSKHGEAIVVDHVGLQLYGENAVNRAPLTLTLVLDLHTATIAGFQTMLGPPSPAVVYAALRHAEHSSKNNAGGEVLPKLLLDAPTLEPWRALIDRLEFRGMASTVRWGARLRTGMFAQRLIGPRIGQIAISPRVPKGGAAFDPNRHAVVSLHQAEFIVAAAVKTMNAERLGSDVQTNRIVIPDLRKVVTKSANGAVSGA